MSADKLNAAIAAFQAGDKATAKSLFQEVISTDPNNDTAWYYFAALQDDPARRRAALNKVLEINPDHQRAREVLAAMDAAQASTAAAGAPASPPKLAAPPPAARPASPDPMPPVSPSGTSSAPPPPPAPVAPSAGGAGFALPFSIPGAPERVTLGGLWQEWLQLFLAGVNVLMRKPGVYEQEIARGTWWRFWLLVMGIAVVSSVVTLIMSLLGGWFLTGILSAAIRLFLTAGIAYAGVWLSDWWAKRQGSLVPQGQHAMTAALAYVPAAIIATILGIFPIIGGFLGLVISIYSWWIMGLGFQSVHQFREANQNWFTVAFFILGVILGGIILGLIVGVLGAPLAIGAALF